MKFILIIAFLLSFKSLANDCSYDIKYDSLEYNILVTYCCEEGNLDCDKVYYKGVNKKDQSSIYLKGRTINNALSHRFLGYQFENNGYTYIIQNNLLSIYKGEKLLQNNTLYEIE
ncbi:hypothetical protein RHO14_10465 [Orbus wheelerorum]|uniref:hypothetical protein n=1 Tax=Orbus wheelerorum TaxID=3074111 RepID=UPI00370DB5A0